MRKRSKPRTAFQQKGDALEYAVQQIESLILRTAPGLREGAFTIEPKKVLVLDGVRHEFDLFVTVEIASGYRAVFIFECKNQVARVGKNDVIAFAEKKRVVNAQHAYFVARAFSRDATAQAAKDGIALLHAEALDSSAIQLEMYDSDTSRLECLVAFPPEHAHRIEIAKLPAMQLSRLGTSEAFGVFRDRWQSEICHDLQHDFRASPPVDGPAHYKVDLHQHYVDGEANVDGIPIREIVMRGYVAISQRRLVFKSAFDVKTRGRVGFFEDENGERFALHLSWPAATRV